MTWTYTNNPAGSSRDALRLAVGDTIENDPRLSDEEVEHFLSLYPDSLDLAAAAGGGGHSGQVLQHGRLLCGRSGQLAPPEGGVLPQAGSPAQEPGRVEVVAEAEESLVASPGVSPEALHRGALFKRGVGL